MSEPQPLPLPVGLKRASVVAMIAGAMLGILAAHSMAAVLQQLDDATIDRQPAPVIAGTPPGIEKLIPAFTKSYIRNLEGMRGSRVAILMLLSIASSLLFVSSLRMLRPLGVPREGVRRLMGGAAFACALFSTLEGAQSTAAARRASAAMARVATEEGIAAEFPAFLGASMVALMGFFTLFAAGTSMLLWMYFKSPRVQEQVAELEKSS